MLVSVGQILIIPYVVIVVTFYVCSVFLRLLDLSPRRSAHYSSHVDVLEHLKQLILFFLFLFLRFSGLLLCFILVLVNPFFICVATCMLDLLSRSTLIVLWVHGLQVFLLKSLYVLLLFAVLLPLFLFLLLFTKLLLS
jgi:hypothetical protein